MNTTRFLLTAGVLAIFTSPADAQDLQIPSVVVNAVQTAVSVPDRGSAFLGGVSRGASSSNLYGFSSIGSSVGRVHSNTAQSVFVTIHDFEEADQLLLSAPRNDGRDRRQFKSPRAKQAWKQLESSPIPGH